MHTVKPTMYNQATHMIIRTAMMCLVAAPMIMKTDRMHMHAACTHIQAASLFMAATTMYTIVAIV